MSSTRQPAAKATATASRGFARSQTDPVRDTAPQLAPPKRASAVRTISTATSTIDGTKAEFVKPPFCEDDDDETYLTVKQFPSEQPRFRGTHGLVTKTPPSTTHGVKSGGSGQRDILKAVLLGNWDAELSAAQKQAVEKAKKIEQKARKDEQRAKEKATAAERAKKTGDFVKKVGKK